VVRSERLDLSDALGYGIGGSPSRLEIETSRNTVNVEHLTGEIQMRNMFAL
jgi:hypothetical protein